MAALQVAICEPAPPFVPCEFRIRRAAGGWERTEALRLRRAVFCIEQGLFAGDDLDAIDAAGAQTIVALSCVGGMVDQVVGTVRVHEAAPGVWWGSRLAVHAGFRRHGRLGAGLIRLAVESAHALGCRRFFAHVQAQNIPMFERLHWTLLGHETLHGRPHGRMQANLAHYPPCADSRTGFVARSAAAP